ncbi:MAG: PEP/pyruvate-binding domain-containing protein [Betaproteobacteria bacterium]|nr:PEP/pyruvate-binding domain-containing protein [Betaproteobacteria bacterium]
MGARKRRGGKGGDRRVYLIGAGAALAAGATPEEMGFKAYNLARMASIGMPVPAAFVLSTAFCRDYYAAKGALPEGFRALLRGNLGELERLSGLSFGGERRPLLVSVRSGAAVSMPGMLDTVLNVGLNDATVAGMVRMTGNPRLAWDSYRRLIQSFAEVVHGAKPDAFDAARVRRLKAARLANASELDFMALRELATEYLEICRELTGESFPQTPLDQLAAAAEAVFRSWSGKKALDYRRLHHLQGVAGTAVCVQTMVYGNSGGTSGSGVAFTRDPATGENALYMDFLFNAQGDDVVSGRHEVGDRAQIGALLPEVTQQIEALGKRLEAEFGDLQEFEFTLQNAELFMLQTRSGQRTPLAALRMAVEMVAEGLLEPGAALKRLEGYKLQAIQTESIRVKDGQAPLARAVSAGVGVAVGEIALDAETARRRAAAGKVVILVREDTSTDDVAGIAAAAGILTARGGRTAHAAVVARQLGKVCLVGCRELAIDPAKRSCSIGGKLLREGQVISLDGGTGGVYSGAVDIERATPERELAAVASWRGEVRAKRVRRAA